MRKLPIVCIAATTAASLVWADSTTIHPDKDNTLIQTTDGSLSNGLGDLFVGRTGQADAASRRRGVIHFNVAGAVPAGSTVTAVTLRLYLAKTGDTAVRSLAVYRGSASWGEGSSYFNGGVGAASTTNDATWIHRLWNTSSWTASGGDRASSASASSNVGSAGSAGVYYTWSSATMVSDVQGWLSSPSTNFGWHVLGDEANSGTARRFTSREAVDDPGAHFPELVITYTPPPHLTAGPPRAATAQIAGLRVLGERDLDGHGVPDLVLRDDRRGVLLGGRETATGLQTWPLALDRDLDRDREDPLAIPPR
jgi:hypothetical protein